ncbi:MAG: galactose-1-phosphate uridylyltransferase [Desulfuromonadales bacterium]
MSEFRWDPLKGSWVITENQRSRRPAEFISERQLTALSTCPFCPGYEQNTPDEVYALRPPGSPPNTPGWQVRVVPNKFPVLRIEGQLGEQSTGLYRTMPGVGAHEVIIETPDHHGDLVHMTATDVAAVLQAYRARLCDLRQDRRFSYLQVFKNHGIEAGAPLCHSHSQLMAMPIIPPIIRQELEHCQAHSLAQGSCLVCDLLAQERAHGERVVYDDERFVVLAPFASGAPFELRLFPLQHNHDFTLQTDQDLLHCALALQDMLRRLYRLLQDPPYNLVLHTAPPQDGPDSPTVAGSPGQNFHWHFELVPRLNRLVGFAWGSGIHINPLPPEDAAKFLRDIDLSLSF